MSRLPVRVSKIVRDSHFDGASGIANWDDVITKVKELAVDHDANDERKKPFLKYKELRCPITGKVILRLPVASTKGHRAFQQLNSLSRNITKNGLKKRLLNGQHFDGFSVFDMEGLLFADEIGFPDDEAMECGLQIASEFIESVTSSHASGLRELFVGMDVSNRAALVSGKSDHALLKSLTQEDCDFMNPAIRAILGCEADVERSSLTRGSGVIPAENQTQSSVKMNVVAIALLQTRRLNRLRVEATDCVPATVDGSGLRRDGRVSISRGRKGDRKSRKLVLLHTHTDPNDEEKKTKKLVSAVVQKSVQEELKLVNFIVNRSISFRSIGEQRDFYVDMCEYVNNQCM